MNDKEIQKLKKELMKPNWTENLHHKLETLQPGDAIKIVESMANSVEDYLIDGLNFKLSPGASHVTNRRSCTWYTSGAQTYVSGQRGKSYPFAN